MCRHYRQWIAGFFFLPLACSTGSVVLAQDTQAYATLGRPTYAMPTMVVPRVSGHATTSHGTVNVEGVNFEDLAFEDLAAEVALLRDEIQQIRDKEAAAKEKAAGKPSVKAGGRMMVDWAAFDQNDTSVAQAGDFRKGTEFRRARLFLAGEAFDNIDYKIQFDFVGQTDFKDVHATVKQLPCLGNVRVGHFKEPFSLENLTSSKYITFMERGLNNVFTPGYSIGLMAFDHTDDENMTMAVGVFTSTIEHDPPIFPFDDFDDADGTALTTRWTFLPWYDEATHGRSLLHTGLCYTYRDIPELIPGGDERFRLRARPDSHLAGRVVDTGFLDDSERANAVDAEAAWVHGPWSVQSEYTWYFLERSAVEDPTFHGGYVYISYFLTGENRQYKRTKGAFDRVRPYQNFFRVRTDDSNVCTGTGAWELGYRWSYLNLTDTGVRGGELHDHTFGLNWYLNPYTRVMLNYIHSETDDTDLGSGTGRVDLVQTRFQIDF